MDNRRRCILSYRKNNGRQWEQTSEKRRSRRPARRRARPAVEELEYRLALSVGGGWIASTQVGQSGDGILGQYYNNSALSGTPSFTCWDDRVDSNAYPGGSPDPAFGSVRPSGWSARWTGTLTANFSETYTFRINSAGNGVRLWVTPVGHQQGNPIIDDWTYHGQTTDTAIMTLQAGQNYAVELDFSEASSSVQQVQLQWSSPHTPMEDIEPVTQVGLNVDGGDALFANMVNGGTRTTWWDPNTGLVVPTDSNLWPEADAKIFLGEGDTTTEAGGAYLVQFNGQATVTNWPQTVDWWVNGTDLHCSTLEAGQGYDPNTNTTTATMVVTPGKDAGFYMTFTNTSRNPNLQGSSAKGITNLYVMQPSTLGGNTPLPVGTLFTNSALNMISQYTVLRLMDLNSTNNNLTSNWSDRTLVSDNFWSAYACNSGTGVNTGVSGSPNAGVPWEIQIALANELGKDVYINIPSNVSVSYLTNLANLFAYGSDGVNPYTSVQSDPVWKPLNPNLKVYIEFSNETWNSGFVQAESRCDGWANQLSQRALYDHLMNIQNDPLYPGGGSNAYNDGAILASYYNVTSNNDSAFLNTYNPNPAPSTDGGSPVYFNNSSSINGYGIGQGWIGLRDVQISNAFKMAFGETDINAVDTDSRVRPVFEWQYGGNWSGALGFINCTYGAQHPVGYYLYGGGGGWYADNNVGGFSDVSFVNPAFADGLTGWPSNGSVGVVANGSSMGNPNAPPLFSAIAITNGATESGNMVTITTTTPNDFVVGQSVTVSGVTVSGYNGTCTITSTTPTTFTFQSGVTGLANSGGGIVTGTTSSGQTAYLQPGASISQNVTFSGGYADITLYATQTVPCDWYHGLTITLIPTDGGPAINNGQPIPAGEGAPLYSGNQNGFVWNRSAAFYTGNAAYTYTVTFASTLPSGTVFFSGVAIQTVNGMFNETTAALQSIGLNISSDIESDVNLALQYGLYDVGYEGGYDFNQNQSGWNDVNGYLDMGSRGWSSGVPNVGMYANLDPRTKQLAINTLHEFYGAGGTLPIVFESSSNINSWAVAAPSYFDWNTSKQQAVASVEQTLQPTTYGLTPGQSATSTSWWLNPGQMLDSTYLVPLATYAVTMTFGADPGAPAGQTDSVELLVDGQVMNAVNVPVDKGGSFTIPLGPLAAGQHSVALCNTAPSGNANLFLGRPCTSIYTLTCTPSLAAATTPVDLGSSFNRTGIISDRSAFCGGLDGGGSALSANLLGTSQTWNGTAFSLGAPGSSDVVSTVGQTISLPAGYYASLQFLAVAVNGNQRNQTFTVTYADGTTATFTQSISDWYTPQNYAGESIAVTMNYRDVSNGTKDNRTFYVYGYSFELNATKTITSITLPNQDNVKILAINLVF